ncbi:MAG TPA: cytochrome c maturation protein CcmE [Candidatus Limnocylindrales bacterium]|nr:cytochrome c maturation protein CcmE [Candidatus Limnocylindrales bacterium]
MKIDSRIIIGSLVIIFILVLTYSMFSNYIEKYKTINEVITEKENKMIWVNGSIQKNSFISSGNGEYTFTLTDGISTMNVSFAGELPLSLAADSKVVILGTLNNSTFYATKIITKCPTKYEG